MTTKDQRALANDLRAAALIAARALVGNVGKAVGAVAADHDAGATCAQTIVKVSGIKP